MEVLEIAKQIKKLINLIDVLKSNIKDRGIEKAVASADYEKVIALTIIKLRNGKEFEFKGEIISDPPVTIIEKIAKGICYKEKLELEKAEAMYKSLITNLQATEAQLNAYQSLNKYLDNS